MDLAYLFRCNYITNILVDLSSLLLVTVFLANPLQFSHHETRVHSAIYFDICSEICKIHKNICCLYRFGNFKKKI